MDKNKSLYSIQAIASILLLSSKLILAYGFNIGWLLSGTGYIFTNYFNYRKKLKIMMVTVSLMIFVSFYGFYKSQIGIGEMTFLDWIVVILAVLVGIYVVFLQFKEKELTSNLLILQICSTIFGILAWLVLSLYGKESGFGWLLMLTAHVFIGSMYLKLGKSFIFVGLQVISGIIAFVKMNSIYDFI